jgi:outer membrane protein assembly factor BamB
MPLRQIRTPGRRLLCTSATVMGAAALALSLVPSAGAAEQRAAAEDVLYQSRPSVDAPVLTTTTTGREDPGLLLTTPGSTEQTAGGAFGDAAIYDNSGELVWFRDGQFTNLQEVVFDGEPALAMFDADRGEYIVLDSSYTEIASFGMEGYRPDGHSLAFNEDGSRALIAAYNPVVMDLTEYGGLANAEVLDSVIQEVDTQTGEVLFEWSALDHIPLEETQDPLDMERVDYVHTNSASYSNDGDILMSGRATSTVYKIDSETGEIIWRFGGENSDFTFADAADMPSYQHDAVQLPDGRLSVFDNGNRHTPQQSRGAVYAIDEQAMTAELEQDLQPEQPVFAPFTGSNQQAGNGNQLVDYGSLGQMVEFSGTEAVFTATLPETWFTYRAERSTDWVGTPATKPDVAWSEPAQDGSRDFYMSWNGATEVDAWSIRARGDHGRVDQTVERTGFETEALDVALPRGTERVRVSALDDCGRVLGTTVLTPEETATITG